MKHSVLDLIHHRPIMLALQALLSIFAFATITHALPPSTNSIVKVTRDDKFAWGPCPETVAVNTSAIPLLCSNFTVPLDYSDPSSTDTLTLELIKAPALRGPSKGTIFVNYGGPGASGELDLPPFALYQQA